MLEQLQAELYCKESAKRGCVQAIKEATNVEEAIERIGHYYETEREIQSLQAQLAEVRGCG